MNINFFILLCPVKNVNNPDNSNPLKTLRLATTGNDEIIRSPDLQHQRRKKKKSIFLQH